MKKKISLIFSFIFLFIVGITGVKADSLKVGDYVQFTPSKSTYSVSNSVTGHATDQTIKPSELKLWRVIKVNSNGTFDEYLTNVRGITAIQNCDNLRNTEIVFETVGYSGKYNTMANDVYTHNLNDYKFEFASDLSYFPWEQLEEYFAATSDNDPDLIESKLVAKKINEFIGMDVPLSKNYLKFANTIRKLMKLNNNGVYDECKFNRFMIEYFSKDLIKGLVKELKFDQEKV